MTEPRRPRDLDETLLDDGRVRRFPAAPGRDAALAETLLDEGRQRPVAQVLDWGQRGEELPEPLSARYKLIRRLEATGSQAELFLVRVRETGEEVVLKRYRPGREPHPDVVSFLSPRPDHVLRYPEHVVGYREFGPGYEVMEYLPGGSLLDWRRAHPEGLDAAAVRAVAQQVAAALVALHRQHLVHRDIKPANLMLRSTDPLDLAVVDFGIACPPGDARLTEQPNPAYQPPEAVLLGRVEVAGDWWSLGMTLLELAAGEHPFEGLAPEDIRGHFGAARIVDVSGVPDEVSPGGGRRDRLRNLCQGLLTSDPARRWGEREVSDWLIGRDPRLPGVVPRRAVAGRAGGEQIGAEHPYVFNGARYYLREDLAQAVATAWDRAVEVLFSDEGRLDELRVWLDQFPDDNGAEARRVVDQFRQEVNEPGRVQLLRLVRALAPTLPATYRNHIVSRRHLLTIAHRALANEGDTASVLSDLWTYRLLPMFDAAVPADSAAESGGQALADLDRQWRAEWRRWSAAAARVEDLAARNVLAEATSGTDVLAVCLRAALRNPDDVAAARALVRETGARLPEPVPWFAALAGQADLVWLALLLGGLATSQARSVAEQRAADAAQAEARQAAALFHAWSRRQNRPAALGWAVAGVCLMAAAWIALITASDAANWAGDTAIHLAWVAAAVCAAVSLVAECLFAADVGGRFHARYSIPGAGVIALRPLAQWMRRAWLPAGATALGVLAGVTLVALLAPLAVAPGTTAGHLIWVAHRWAAWRRALAAEEDLIAQAERRGPSDTDGAPIGAREGAGT